MENNLNALENFIKSSGSCRTLSKHDTLFRLNEPINEMYFLESGYLKITQENENGEMVTLAMRTPGQICGLCELLAEQRFYTRYAFCLTDCVVYVLSAELFNKFLDKHPKVWQQLCKLMSQRLIESQHYMYVLTRLTVPERLCWLLKKFAVEKGSTISTSIPLTHEEMAHLIGCSRQKVTGFLNAWREQGLIRYERKRVEILQPDELFAVLDAI